MQTQITLETDETTVQFTANLEVYAPHILCIDKKYYYYLTNVDLRGGVLSAIYKPASIVEISEPQDTQVFKKAS